MLLIFLLQYSQHRATKAKVERKYISEVNKYEKEISSYLETCPISKCKCVAAGKKTQNLPIKHRKQY